MSENHCPQCHNELDWQGRYHCQHCAADFNKIAFCPDCEAKLEKLQACGAANYFCHSSRCNELKSKSRVRFEFQKSE
ncbi:zinc ribbon domain-containing protein [Vibrio renipiscarius]|uniref:zinc ribbon domain-containing protein n=1 Tax=Vibrio renipiscarius TaxID=1461322 RepID=UPI0009E2582D|nr:zinc ribbon domain-containing protein [Vibrio renipiscarius]